MLKKNIIANYFGQFYSIIIGIVMVPFYLQYLGAEAYGLVGFFALMTSWMMLLDMGISPTLSREVAKTRTNIDENTKQLFKKFLHSLEFVFIIIALSIVTIIFLYSSDIATRWLTIETLDIDTVTYCISLMGIMIGLRFIISLYNSGISGAEKQVWQNIANITIQTLKFVGVLFILKFISTDIKHFFEYQFIIAVLEFILFSTKFYRTMDIGRFKVFFSYSIVKPHIPFALGIAYTAGIWVFLTQFDKFLLSGILPLTEYGYFAIVALVANAIMQISSPISKAILPRLTSLLNQGKEDEMIFVYKKATQLMSVFIFSVVGIVAFFSYELLYSWTGDIELSTWASPILFWYVLGNGILAVGAFQYYLQFAHGKLSMHVKYNTIFPILSIPAIYFAAYEYGALGVALVWFGFRLVSFFVWVPIVHHKFAPGIHKDWMIKDVMPMFLSTVVFLTILHYLDINFEMERFYIFMSLLGLGVLLLITNILVSGEGRKMMINFIKRNKS